jgi:3-phosphoshikimate 1-carboxyvinyltransferase
MRINLQSFYPDNLTVELNHSKSLYIRFLIAYFLKNGTILPVSNDEAKDVLVVAQALQQIHGAVSQNFPCPVYVKDCGTAWRFFTALLSVTQGKWLLYGSERLMQRPIKPLILALQSIGADIEQTAEGLFIQGKTLRTEDMTINTSESSQFASALQLIAPKTGLQKLHLIPDNPPSFPYIEMTKKVTARVENDAIPFSVEEIEADWSSAAFWYAMAILRHTDICFKNLHLHSWQGDSILAQWANYWNIESCQIDNDVKIYVAPQNLSFSAPQVIDFSNVPDLAPILMVLSLLTNQEFIFSGLQNLNLKESKRKDVILEELSPFAAFEMLNDHTLKMRNIRIPKGKTLSFSSHQDHRLVMAFTLFALYNEVEIDNVEAVKKSYPKFFNQLLFG